MSCGHLCVFQTAMLDIMYTENARGLIWTESIEEEGLEAALLEAAARGELERAAALVNHGAANLERARALAAKARGNVGLVQWFTVRMEEREAKRWEQAALRVRQMR